MRDIRPAPPRPDRRPPMPRLAGSSGGRSVDDRGAEPATRPPRRVVRPLRRGGGRRRHGGPTNELVAGVRDAHALVRRRVQTWSWPPASRAPPCSCHRPAAAGRAGDAPAGLAGADPVVDAHAPPAARRSSDGILGGSGGRSTGGASSCPAPARPCRKRRIATSARGLGHERGGARGRARGGALRHLHGR
jgi:hypothetical protein